MQIDLDQLENLIANRIPDIEAAVAGTGYKPKTALGVAIFLLDNLGDTDILTAKQLVTFERFLLPLLDDSSRD